MQNIDANRRIASLAEQVSVLTAMLGSVIGHLGNGSACFQADPLCALCVDAQTCSLCREVRTLLLLSRSHLSAHQLCLLQT